MNRLVMSKQPGHGLFMRVTEKKREATPRLNPADTAAVVERDILAKHVKLVEKRCATLSTQLALEIEAKTKLQSEMERLADENALLAEDKRSALASVDLLSDQVRDLQDQTSCIPSLHNRIHDLEKADRESKERITSMKRKDEEWKSEIKELLRECASLRRDLATSEQEKQVVKNEAAKLLVLFEKETQENLANQERLFESFGRPNQPMRPTLRRSRKVPLVDEEIEAIRKLIYPYFQLQLNTSLMPSHKREDAWLHPLVSQLPS